MTNEEIVKSSFRIMKEYIEDGKDACEDVASCYRCPFEEWEICPMDMRKGRN